jgi:hypothetical protein
MKRISLRHLMTVASLMALAGTASAVEVTQIAATQPDVLTIEITGKLDEGDALKARGIISNLDQKRQIVAEISSNGGLYAEARSLGKFLYDAKIKTVVPAGKNCFGACMLLLVAGRDLKTGESSYVKSSTGRIVLTAQLLKYDEAKEYNIKDYARAITRTEDLFRDNANYLASVKARPGVLRYFMLLAPGEKSRDLTNEQALEVGIPVYDEKAKQMIKPIAAR